MSFQRIHVMFYKGMPAYFCTCARFSLRTPYQYCAVGKIEKNEMGGACGAYGGGKRCAQGSDWET